jgi:uncharacterized protein
MRMANPFSKEKSMKKVLVSIFSLAIVLSLSNLAAGQAYSNSPNDQLIAPAQNGDTAAVRQLLNQGANIEARDAIVGATALIEAAFSGNAETVKLLLERGANIEARGNDTRTALMTAARWGRIDVVELLLAKGANIEAKDMRGDTALTFATRGLHSDVANLLRAKGAH